MMNALRSDHDSEPAAVPFRRGAQWLALGAAILTLPLLYVGGSVTTYRVGMAVPDWPSTFGINMFLFNMWEHPFGVRIEHSHRLYGALVGVATLVLAGWLLAFESRKWLKGVGLLAVALVIVQGVLGGFRVTQNSTFLASVHGVVGQAFFALMVALYVFTGRRWQAPAHERIDAGRVRLLGFALFTLVPVQIALGSWLRHFGTWPALAGHSALAALVWGCCLFLAFYVEQRKSSWRPLVPSARALGLVVTLQVALGIGSFIALLPFDGTPRAVSFYQAVTRTAHQTSGALLLAAVVIFNLRCLRHTVGGSYAARSLEESTLFRPAGPAAREWEAVA
jgi:cytochrome c oxidase assembly protein subunit 15